MQCENQAHSKSSPYFFFFFNRSAEFLCRNLSRNLAQMPMQSFNIRKNVNRFNFILSTAMHIYFYCQVKIL